MIPVARIGMYVLVIIASGRLSIRPTKIPLTQNGIGGFIFTTTNPIANLLINAPKSAAFLSGNDKGNIKSTAITPKAKPATTPVSTLFIRYQLE